MSYPRQSSRPELQQSNLVNYYSRQFNDHAAQRQRKIFLVPTALLCPLQLVSFSVYESYKDTFVYLRLRSSSAASQLRVLSSPFFLVE